MRIKRNHPHKAQALVSSTCGARRGMKGPQEVRTLADLSHYQFSDPQAHLLLGSARIGEAGRERKMVLEDRADVKHSHSFPGCGL